MSLVGYTTIAQLISLAATPGSRPGSFGRGKRKQKYQSIPHWQCQHCPRLTANRGRICRACLDRQAQIRISILEGS